MLDYDELIETMGIRIPFVKDVITPKIERPLRNGRYEAGECRNMQSLLRPGDRVLDIGAGIGLVSSVAAKVDGVQVTAIEANPNLIEVIEETYRVNGISNVALRHGVIAPEPVTTEAITFYLRPDFWASSMEPDSRAYVSTADVPCIGLSSVISEFAPSVISCDIEGAELGLFDSCDLSGVRHIILELHPKVYGEEGERAIIDGLAAKGFGLSPTNKPGSTVRVFDGASVRMPLPGSVMPKRPYKTWPVADPRLLVATCMKDEGPFILEWIAWHQAMGVTDFVVFSNDCSDGTDRILERLETLGAIRHLPNPALATGTERFQPAALNYLHYLPEFRDADFFLSMDVDEFVNIRCGDGRFADLLGRLPRFDVMSISELNHGSNGRETFEPGWVTEQFPGHESETPGKYKAMRGVKSIVRLSQSVLRVRNHRPDMSADHGAMVWLDGSGRTTTVFHDDSTKNGHDVRGTYDLVSLEHYALRSLDSYLVKMFRGDVVVKGKQVSQRYWRTRNRNEQATSADFHNRGRARERHDALLADAELARLHEAACAAHRDRIAALRQIPAFEDRRKWALDESWG